MDTRLANRRNRHKFDGYTVKQQLIGKYGQQAYRKLVQALKSRPAPK
jgi:hypothetical protein